MLMKIDHGCTKGINVLRPIECQKKQNTAVLTVLTLLDGGITYQNIEHGRTKHTNILRPTARMCINILFIIL